MNRCSNCGDGPARRRGLCDPCYMWARRHDGADRPESALLRHWTRLIETEMVERSLTVM